MKYNSASSPIGKASTRHLGENENSFGFPVLSNEINTGALNKQAGLWLYGEKKLKWKESSIHTLTH